MVLADEINRATPKTQSALLEAMSERQVSVDGKRTRCPEPFVVLATQNPLEYHGTYPLPESQLDRFLMRSRSATRRGARSGSCCSRGGRGAARRDAPGAHPRGAARPASPGADGEGGDKLADYMLALAEATRHGGDLLLGVSTRGVQSLYRATQALALTEGRSFAIPDDVQRLAVPVLGHGWCSSGATASFEAARRAIERTVQAVPVPL